ncbi:MAG: prepilin-type N-terminal cleavage/methylation domain-containing protein [Nitrospinae bacterium]|nr:prepilin-type N-terminal cleavage/methylation domain-containing protein [Nitrospinota bacterium]
MIQKFTSKFESLRNGDKGFTLIELMIVIAIIGILAAIAIPQFAKYREKAYDAASKADITNMATALESYFLDNGTYTTDQSLLTGFNSTTSVTLVIGPIDATGFTATAKHTASAQTFTYISSNKGLQ